jgi:hypothetical protein
MLTVAPLTGLPAVITLPFNIRSSWPKSIVQQRNPKTVSTLFTITTKN